MKSKSRNLSQGTVTKCWQYIRTKQEVGAEREHTHCAEQGSTFRKSTTIIPGHELLEADGEMVTEQENTKNYQGTRDMREQQPKLSRCLCTKQPSLLLAGEVGSKC